MALTLRSNPSRDECAYVTKHLRKQEAEEFKAMMSSPSFSAMESVDSSSQAFVISNDNDPIALCGIVDTHKDLSEGVVWLMSSNLITKAPIAFYKIIKDLVTTYGHLYDMLYNYVEVSAAEHLFFIESLGFIISDDVFVNNETEVKYYKFEYVCPKALDKMYHEATE